MSSYHDLHITTDSIERTSIFDLPFGYMLTCSRVGGWELWHDPDNGGIHAARAVAGEYGDRGGLRLDVSGHVIVDSLTEKAEAA